MRFQTDAGQNHKVCPARKETNLKALGEEKQWYIIAEISVNCRKNREIKLTEGHPRHHTGEGS